jgi:hypothetical protein
MLNFLKKINHIRLQHRIIEKLRRRKNDFTKFGPNAKAIYVQAKQGNFLVDPVDNYVARVLLNDGELCQGEIKLASRFIKKRFLLPFAWRPYWFYSYSTCKNM